jgi:hypothetical protein
MMMMMMMMMMIVLHQAVPVRDEGTWRAEEVSRFVVVVVVSIIGSCSSVDHRHVVVVVGQFNKYIAQLFQRTHVPSFSDSIKVVVVVVVLVSSSSSSLMMKSRGESRCVLQFPVLVLDRFLLLFKMLVVVVPVLQGGVGMID